MSRLTELQQWLESIAANTYTNLQAASADASFRQYFRVTNTQNSKTYIVMDAPTDKEDCRPFIQITNLIRDVDVNAPNIVAKNIKQGFLLLDDLGSTSYMDHLDADTVERLYVDAIDALIKMQSIYTMLPAYDKTLLQAEMFLFETWYVEHHLNTKLTAQQQITLNNIFDLLINSALEQPQVFVHRDYHSRNLMITDENNPGVIDYQDAVNGPITYDLVSLFKDCYIKWPREKVEHWLDLYLARLTPTHFIEKETLLKWFDFMGVQRHLKVLGIFSRLNYRDNKPQYLDDLPLTLKYITDCCALYPELQPLEKILSEIHNN